MELKRKTSMHPVMRENEQNGLEYLTFPSLEETGVVAHLVSTRIGGVSEGIFSSLNYSVLRGDSKEAVQENYRRTAAVFGRSLEDFVCSDQTHTTNIRVVTKEDWGKGVTRPKDYKDVDGLVTDEPGLILATFYADCVPLLFVDPVRRAIGCSHSGWRGTAQEMGRVTIERMKQEFGCKAQDILAAVGPSICQACYEVSQDVADVFFSLFSRQVYENLVGEKKKISWEELLQANGSGKYLLNLWKANEAILLAAGVLPQHISVTDVCTCCNPQVLFSHRASRGKRGNLGVFMMLKETQCRNEVRI